MGGNAAKERRRLKRLEQIKESASEEGAETASKTDPKKTGSTKNHTNTPNTAKSSSTTQSDKKRKASPPNQNQTPNTKQTNKRKKSNYTPNKNNNKNDSSSTTTTQEIKKKKVKKPKHLSRKLAQTTNPKQLNYLQKQQDKLESKKNDRIQKFKSKVIQMIGGNLDLFDEDAFNGIMAAGGAKLENILKAVKIDESSGKSNEFYKNKVMEEAGGVDHDENVTDMEVDEVSQETEKENQMANDDNMESSQGNNQADTTQEIVVDEINQESNDTNATKGPQKDIEPTTVQDEPSKQENDDEEEGDEEVDASQKPTRTRGRRRRGRKDADSKRHEHNKDQALSAEMKKAEEENNQEQSNSSDKDSSPRTNTQKLEDKRRCIGRKPLTDYELGKKYSGTVKYVKPTLGVFVDIGCHYDAFCHVSCLSNEFVEDASSIFTQGDIIENACITAIDRRRKKITFSLKSKPKIDKYVKGELLKSKDEESTSELVAEEVDEQSAEEKVEESNDQKTDTYAELLQVSTENMTPAEVKRHRKLLRRAERRKLKDETGISA